MSDPITVALRPLNGGMVKNVAANQLPMGCMITLQNLMAVGEGLRRRPELSRYGAGLPGHISTVNYPPIRDFITVWASDGSQKAWILDQKGPYIVSLTGLLPVFWTYNTGTVKQSGTHIVGAGTGWTVAANLLRKGDVVRVMSGILALVSDTILNIVASNHLVVATSTTIPAGKSYQIHRAFDPPDQNAVDWTVEGGHLIVVDGARPPYKISGTSFGIYTTAITAIPTCISSHLDRIFFGRTIESGVDWRQRVRWTTPLAKYSLPALQFVDRPYRPSYIKRLIPLADYLIAYSNDAIEVGRETNYYQGAGDDLPVAFQKLNTGGVGLSGPRAICSWQQGHFFVGASNFYLLTTDLQLLRIGDPIVHDAILPEASMDRAYVVPDPANNCILWGIPRGGPTETFFRVWRYNLDSKAWSFDSLEGEMLASMGFSIKSDYSNLPLGAGDYTGLDLYPTYDAIRGRERNSVWVGRNGKLYFLGTGSGSTDAGGDPIPVIIETPDFDFDVPDQVKTVLRLGLKLDRLLVADLAFTVEVSGDRGLTWKRLTASRLLNIPAGTDENYVNFRFTGSICRFRLTSTSRTEQYTVCELTLRVAARGAEIHVAANEEA